MSTSTPSNPIALGLCRQREIDNTVAKIDTGKDRFARNFLLVTDFALVGICGLAVCYFRFVFNIPTAPLWNLLSRALFGRHMAFVLLYAVLFVLLAHARKLYIDHSSVARKKQVFDVLKSSASAAMIVIAANYLSGNNQITNEYIGVTVFFSSILLAARQVSVNTHSIRVQRNVAIVGAGRVGLALGRYLSENPQLGMNFVGYVDRRMANRYVAPTDVNDSVPLLGSIADLEDLTKIHFIDEILVTLPGDRNLVKDVAAHARRAGIDLRVVPDLFDGLAYGAPVEHLGSFPTLAVYQKPIPSVQLLLKRMSDIVLSSLALVTLMPLFVFVAIAIKLNSRGRIFHSSNRVGKKGTTFTCYKFRTMVSNAERMKQDLHHLNERDGVLFKISNDPRVTSLGRSLRKFSIDELPQLWNVLKGDMSLVGPRPALVGEYKQYAIDNLRRLEVAPGITGLWQVEARQSPSFDDYINLDIEYVENWNVWLDVKLIFRTVLVVFAGTGS